MPGPDQDDEDVLLRSVALQNAASILRARQRAEAELLAAKEALERTTAELKLAEEALRKQSEWLRVTFASIGDAVITTDGERRVTFLNRVAEQMTGWTVVEAAGLPLETVFRIVDETTREPSDNPAAAALATGRIVGLANHTMLIAKDGTEHAIDDSAAPIRDDAGAVIGVVLIFRDITARRRDEAKLRASTAELQASDRRKDEFLALLAHELRNPLAPIVNSVQVLRATNPPTPESQWAMDVVDRQVNHMTRLIDDLLDVSRINTGKVELRKERVALTTIVTSAVEAARPLIEMWGHELTLALPPEPVHLHGDPARLSQVILNLLNNAAKYTQPGGRIGLTAGIEDGRAVFRVKDNGIGIPSEMLPRIFEMFTQGDRSLERARGGLGAGLTLVRSLVALHGGTVEGHSHGADLGSEFVVSLPLGELASVESPDAPTSDGGTHAGGAKHRILVVDDNTDSAESLGILLRMLGNDVRVAYDGLTAVTIASEFSPEFALLDIGLPGLNGYEAARRIRERLGRDVVLIAITGWGQEEDRQRSKEAGFDHHLMKPVREGALMALLTTARE